MVWHLVHGNQLETPSCTLAVKFRWLTSKNPSPGKNGHESRRTIWAGHCLCVAIPVAIKGYSFLLFLMLCSQNSAVCAEAAVASPSSGQCSTLSVPSLTPLQPNYFQKPPPEQLREGRCSSSCNELAKAAASGLEIPSSGAGITPKSVETREEGASSLSRKCLRLPKSGRAPRCSSSGLRYRSPLA